MSELCFGKSLFGVVSRLILVDLVNNSNQKNEIE